MAEAHPSEAELSAFVQNGLHICEHLRACLACRQSIFSLESVRKSADSFDADPPWIVMIDGVQSELPDSDAAAPVIAAAWRQQKNIQCHLATDWEAFLGLAARVNRILESEGWNGPWWVPATP